MDSSLSEREKLITRVARLLLGLDSMSRLSEFAVDALVAGFDSPALRELAACENPSFDEGIAMLNRTLAEMGMVLPSKRDAVMRLARQASRDILRGVVGPYEGGKAIWQLARSVPEERLEQLDPFIYAASEWEDRPRDRPYFEQAILETAKELCGPGS